MAQYTVSNVTSGRYARQVSVSASAGTASNTYADSLASDYDAAGTYSFAGSPATGAGVASPVALKGTVTESVNCGYTNPHWKVSGIAATAAVSPEWTYVDMT
jgi:hypothetical protein